VSRLQLSEIAIYISANGAGSIPAWGNAPGNNRRAKKSAEGAIHSGRGVESRFPRSVRIGCFGPQNPFDAAARLHKIGGT
jgi:hypothetical protein